MGVISDPVLISSKASVMRAISSTFRQILMEAGKEHNKSFVHSTPTHFFFLEIVTAPNQQPAGGCCTSGLMDRAARTSTLRTGMAGMCH
jgi:hypothetical protein